MATARSGSPGRHKRGKVLIVDDQDSVRELFRAILEGDYDVAEADCGAALQEALRQEQPDVVLLDLKLPDTSGTSLLPAIFERWPGTQVIIMTGAVADSEAMARAAEAIKRGAHSLVFKSGDFDCQSLLAGVSSALDRRCQASGQSRVSPSTPTPGT